MLKVPTRKVVNSLLVRMVIEDMDRMKFESTAKLLLDAAIDPETYFFAGRSLSELRADLNRNLPRQVHLHREVSRMAHDLSAYPMFSTGHYTHDAYGRNRLVKDALARVNVRYRFWL